MVWSSETLPGRIQIFCHITGWLRAAIGRQVVHVYVPADVTIADRALLVFKANLSSIPHPAARAMPPHTWPGSSPTASARPAAASARLPARRARLAARPHAAEVSLTLRLDSATDRRKDKENSYSSTLQQQVYLSSRPSRTRVTSFFAFNTTSIIYRSF